MSDAEDAVSDTEDNGPREIEQDLSKTMTLSVGEPEPAPAPVAKAVWDMSVEVVGGPMDGLHNRVEKPSFTIGRDLDNDLSLTMDPMVSGHHARIVREGGHYWLEDLDSRNGTQLGDQRLSERVLISPGTTFTVAQTLLEFMPR